MYWSVSGGGAHWARGGGRVSECRLAHILHANRQINRASAALKPQPPIENSAQNL